MIETEAVNLIPAALMLLLPIGFILLTGSAVPQEWAPSTTLQLLVMWGVAVLGYFAVGFALQFGGIAQVSSHPDLQQLYWEWYPLGKAVDLDLARLWGFAALQGWGLAGPAATTGAFQLFAGNVSLVGLAALLPATVLLHQKRTGLALLISLLTGTILYPIGGNWLWGGGWLSELGFIDFAGSTIVHSVGAWVGLAGAATLGPRIGKYVNGKAKAIPGHNLAFGALGVFILWFGWFGFNPGSELAATGGSTSAIAR
jgi:ammonia channel protein AmtB